ncbi:MAG: cell division topological specificity factor MinE [Candidatus Eremiobacteraeota bacterium]|nr:cell division topological specificity factor MinE [Candidatus Eremiobacteraeota bacterium]
MIEFLKRLFQKQGSSATAKERLRLVLMTDHLELAPEMIDSMKRDLVELISRYVEVDRERIDVTFERQDRTLAMLANIPILSVNRPNGNGAVTEAPNPAPAAAPAAESRPAGAPPVRKRKRRKKARSVRANLPSTA